jgi:hypothetical protein
MDLTDMMRELTQSYAREIGNEALASIHNDIRNNVMQPGGLPGTGAGTGGNRQPIPEWSAEEFQAMLRRANYAAQTENFVRNGVAPNFGGPRPLGSGIGNYMAPSANHILRGHTMANGRVGGYYDEFGNPISEMQWRMMYDRPAVMK